MSTKTPAARSLATRHVRPGARLPDRPLGPRSGRPGHPPLTPTEGQFPGQRPVEVWVSAGIAPSTPQPQGRPVLVDLGLELCQCCSLAGGQADAPVLAL